MVLPMERRKTVNSLNTMETTSDAYGDSSEASDISQWSLDTKIRLLSGSGVWTVGGFLPCTDSRKLAHEIPSITLSDGPHGLRKPLSDLSLTRSHPATCFPPACAMACSWNPQALFQMGQALAKEASFHNVSILLGPAMNLKRHPCGGRHLEYFSEDPCLTGILAASYVRGLQDTGCVGACAKHFAVNNQESHRMVVNALVDERTLRELYLAGFERLVSDERSSPAMVMGAYNQVNGVYACESVDLLKKILRKEWNYQGVCVTDWGATNDRPRAIAAGMDLEMPGNRGACHLEIRRALDAGKLLESQVDACAKRILKLLNTYSIETNSLQKRNEAGRQMLEDNHKLAYELALECIVLLKNGNDVLPLSHDSSIVVVGDFAQRSRYQGMGSSHITPTQVDNALDFITKYSSRSSIPFACGYDANTNNEQEQDCRMIQDAVDVVKSNTSDVILLFLGLPECLESEGFDRIHLQLPRQQIDLYRSVLEAKHPKTELVIVLSNGGVVELPDDLIDNTTAIVEGYLLGQSGSRAVVDILFGNHSPSGKLAETMPLRLPDTPANLNFPGSRDHVQYREGLDVGYRYFNPGAPVRYPFGHGLSFTTFEFDELNVEIRNDTERKKHVRLSFRVRNVGNRAGKETAQVYVAPYKNKVYRPHHELKAFFKTNTLQPGQTSEVVSISLDHRDFAYWDIGLSKWIVEAGSYEIQIGSSSREIRMKKTISFGRGQCPSLLAQESYPPEKWKESTERRATCPTKVSDRTFAWRFGNRKDEVVQILQSFKDRRQQPFKIYRNTLLKDAANFSYISWIFLRLSISVGCFDIPAGPSAERERRMIRENAENLPLRALILFSGGSLSFEFLDTCIDVMNGEYWNAMGGFKATVTAWIHHWNTRSH